MIDTDILEDYTSEARELLDEMDNSLMRLEREGSTPDLLNTIFRAVHCIKGSAEYIGLERSSTLTHGVENLLDRLREGVIQLTPAITDFLFRTKDLISTLISEVSRHHVEKSEVSGVMEELDLFLAGAVTLPSDSVSEVPGAEISGKVEPSLEPVGRTGAADEFAIIPEEDLDETLAMVERPPELIERTEPEIGETFEVAPEIPGEPKEEYFPEIETAPEPVETPQVFEAGPGAAGPEVLDELVSPRREETTPLQVAEEESRAAAEFTLEDAVPYILSICLDLDDLEDGLNSEEALDSLRRRLRLLKDHVGVRAIPAAVQVLEAMESRAVSMSAFPRAVSSEEIERLRSLLYDLRHYYQGGTFPLAPRRAPEQSEAPVKAEPAAPPVPSAFVRRLETVPGMERSILEALLEAGYSSMDELATRSISDLSKISGITPALARAILTAAGAPPMRPKPSAPRAPTERSLLADVDDELLREFQEVFSAALPVEENSAAAFTTACRQGTADLLEELDAISAEGDREIVEIFRSYGLEILSNLRPVVHRITHGRPDRNDLDRAAKLIKSIRSSSTYMDYQKLASFLDDWLEKTLWISERIESLSGRDLAFMEENLWRFDDFLVGLEAVANREAAVVRVTSAAPAPPQASTPSFAPSQPQVEKPMGSRSRPAVTHDRGLPRTGKPPVVRAQDEAGLWETPARELPEQVGPLTAASPPGPALRADQQLAETPTAEHPAPFDVSPDFLREGAPVKTMRVDSSKVDILLNQVGELVVNRYLVEQLSVELKNFQRMLMGASQVGKREVTAIKEIAQKVSEAGLSLGRVANDIQEGVMKLRMRPVGQLFNRMPRLIRDLSRRVDKTVNLEIYGGDTEVDKRVIEQIYNPLVHLIRNAVDHGIEDRATRKERGKSEDGSIILRAYSEGNQVVIDVADDGRGIDKEEVLRRAIENRLIDAEEVSNISAQKIYNFLFLPGFSTSDKVTRTSRRGVGMDVVKKYVERINGRVKIESWENQGTRISIKIPLTLAIIQTLLIRSGKHVFAIPLTSVREIIRIELHEIETIEGFEVIKFREETIPVLRVAEVFNLHKGDGEPPAKFLVITTAGPKATGFLVDELIGEQDVVIKPLAQHVCETRGLAGSTMLGDGTIALVMDVTEIIDDVISQQRQLGLQGPEAVLARRDPPTRA